MSFFITPSCKGSDFVFFSGKWSVAVTRVLADFYSLPRRSSKCGRFWAQAAGLFLLAPSAGALIVALALHALLGRNGAGGCFAHIGPRRVQSPEATAVSFMPLCYGLVHTSTETMRCMPSPFHLLFSGPQAGARYAFCRSIHRLERCGFGEEHQIPPCLYRRGLTLREVPFAVFYERFRAVLPATTNCCNRRLVESRTAKY